MTKREFDAATKNRSFAKPPTLAQQAAERAALNARLGWAPEPPVAAERYCATTAELRAEVGKMEDRKRCDALIAASLERDARVCKLLGH
jgi:hypothetical protein